MKKICLSVVCAIILFGSSAFKAAEDPILTLLKKLDEFTKKYPSEKVYLHLDKPYYAIGDDIWFKAYVTDSRTNEPSSISNILYVDLIDGNDQLKRQLRLEMKSGLAWGDFKLSDSLSDGNYRIRAYTQWMRNAGTDFFFDKTFKVGSLWSNQIYSSATYQWSTKNNQQQIQGILNFANRQGLPLPAINVDYEVIINQKTVSKGQLKTNEQGELRIPVSLNNTVDFKTGSINANITLPGGLKVSKMMPIPGVKTDLSVQFLPEGGSLIEGLPVKIGVKAIDNSGRGQNIKGKIVDNEGIEVLDFETAYLGMGNFLLTPAPGKTYTAKISLKDGSTQLVNLPKAEKSGYAIQITATDSLKIPVRIMRSEDLIGADELQLIVHQQGNVISSTKIPATKQLSVFALPKAGLPPGIITFTLFNAKLSPVAERIMFVSNIANRIQIREEGLKNSTRRGKTELDLFTTYQDKPVLGSFSIAVTNASVIEPDPENESNIFTGLLLSPDLKGYIEKPNHYFLKNDRQTQDELDNLMLTQGWRKIDWKALHESTTPPPYFIAEKGLQISGVVTSGGKPVSKTKVSLLSSGGGLMAIDTLTNEYGRFIFDDLKFGENNTFVIQAKAENGKKAYDISIDKNAVAPVEALPYIVDFEKEASEQLKSYISNNKEYYEALANEARLNQAQNLKEVEVKGDKASKAPNSQNLNGAGNASYVITANDLKSVADVRQALQRVIVREKSDIDLIPVVVDGVMQGQISSIPLQDIESIEVLNGIGYTFIYGVKTQTLFVVTTKSGSFGSAKQLKQVEIVGEKPNKAPNSANFNGPGNADAVFNDNDLKNAVSLTQFLQSRVSGLIYADGKIFTSRNDPKLSIPGQMNGPGAMILFLNGMRMDSTLIDDIPINDIESVEILKSIAYTQVYGAKEGIIMITTKAGANTNIQKKYTPGVINLNPKGFYAIRQFYTPQYTATSDPTPDRRTTLYWNPHLVTDDNGKARISFFNTDQAGKHRIVIEGIDAFGHLARQVFTYDVK